MKFSKFVTKEMIDGFKQWFKVFCYGCGALWLLEFLPKLPKEFAEPIANKLVNLVK